MLYASRMVASMLCVPLLTVVWPAYSDAENIEIIGSIYDGSKATDFSDMITRERYRDTLFIFNDNEEQYKAHRLGCTDSDGNARICHYQCGIPHAAGIPTCRTPTSDYTSSHF